MKVMIADDDLVTRVMLAGVVRKWGYEAVEVTDGAEAWEVLQKPDAPRLLLLDWEMPRLNGLNLCARLYARRDDDPPYIIMLTARTDTDDIVEALERGANDYVTKPFEHAELRARLQVGKRMLDLQRELHKARERLEYQTTTDPLTGLLNQGAVMETLHREISRTRRQAGGQLCVALCAIDHFKRIQDSHGGRVGDRVLKEVSARLRHELRVYDVLGRYGHEEFLLVLSVDGERVSDLLERLCRQVAGQPVKVDGGEISVSITIGAALASATQLTDSSTTLLDTADGALESAKSAGRNNIIVTF